MRIKTITCHDVYNAGASLQAYALQTYLKNQGHNVEIINYKPEYLSRHYRLNVVNNLKYDRPVIRQLYLLAKLPGRFKAKNSFKKKAFDAFRDKYLFLTDIYESFESLVSNPPQADVFIAGSDQIWNPLFPNGKDPSFFLQFVDKGKKVSYAASIAAEQLDPVDFDRMKGWLETFDYISVREESAVKLINDMSLPAQRVSDPVFLLEREAWSGLADSVEKEKDCYIFVNDFDGGGLSTEIARKIRKEKTVQIISWFDMPEADKVVQGGPLEFLNLIKNADLVISNSFHATAFSLIFGVNVLVTKRKESINSRLVELLNRFHLKDRLIEAVSDMDRIKKINWETVRWIIKNEIDGSEIFIKKTISNS